MKMKYIKVLARPPISIPADYVSIGTSLPGCCRQGVAGVVGETKFR